MAAAHMEHTPEHAHDIFKRGVLRATEGRFYTGTGVVVLVVLALASILVWTGVLGQMMTWGDWGFLGVADLLGFLMVMVVFLSAGLIALLLSMRRAFHVVEADLSIADRRVGAAVLRLNQKMDNHLEATRQLLTREQEARARTWQREIQEATNEVRASGRNAATIAVVQAEQRLIEREKKTQPITAEVAELRQNLDATRLNMATVAAQYAMLEELIALHANALAETQAHDQARMQAALMQDRSEFLTLVEARVAEEVRRQVAPESRKMIEAAGRRQRVYVSLGATVAGGLLALAVAGASGALARLFPAIQPVVATLLIGLGIVATTLLVGTFSLAGSKWVWTRAR